MTRIETRVAIAICVGVLLSFPSGAIAEDHGEHSGGNGGGAVSSGSRNNDHGQNEDGDDEGGQAVNPPNPQLQRIRVTFAATDAGKAIGASGSADLRAQGSEQRLKIEMEANVPDGTMFTLAANNLPVGAITMRLGEGEFEGENGQTLAGGLLPASITSIAITDSTSAVVLQAQFGALATDNPGLPPALAIRKNIPLTPTTAGNTVKAEGNADLRSGGAETQLKVEVEGNVPDGTVWTVLANGNVKLGTVTFRLMEAELHLDGAALSQAGLTDGSSIASIQVIDAGANEVLSGAF